MTPKYFLELGQTMGRVEVSDNTLGRVDYDEGMRSATNIVRSQTGAGREAARRTFCEWWTPASSAAAGSSRFPASGPITRCALGGF